MSQHEPIVLADGRRQRRRLRCSHPTIAVPQHQPVVLVDGRRQHRRRAALTPRLRCRSISLSYWSTCANSAVVALLSPHDCGVAASAVRIGRRAPTALLSPHDCGVAASAVRIARRAPATPSFALLSPHDYLIVMSQHEPILLADGRRQRRRLRDRKSVV